MEVINSLTIGQWIFNLMLVLIIADVVLTSIVVTQQKTSKILTMFGKFHKVTQPGLSFKLPWPIVTQEAKIGLQVRQLKGEIMVKSSDNAFLVMPYALQFQVNPNKVKEAYYELGSPSKQMDSYIVNTLRSESSKLTMEQLFNSNEVIETAISSNLGAKFEKYGYDIVNTLIDDPQPSKELKQSFDRVIASKREKEAAKNIAEATKIKMVGEASAEGESLKIKGEAFKEFRMKVAEGNTEAIEKFLENDSSLTSKDVLNFFAGVDLRDAIRDASKNEGSTIIIPVDFQNNVTLPIQKKFNDN